MNQPIPKSTTIWDPDLTIPADSFLFSQEYKDYALFRTMRIEIINIIKSNGKGTWSRDKSKTFIRLNPEFYEVYSLIGDLHMERKEFASAEKYYSQALEKEVVSSREETNIIEKLTRSSDKKRDGMDE